MLREARTPRDEKDSEAWKPLLSVTLLVFFYDLKLRVVSLHKQTNTKEYEAPFQRLCTKVIWNARIVTV